MTVDGPAGFKMRGETPPWAKNKQVDLTGIGRARKESPWPTGTYVGTAQIVRDGAVVAERRIPFELN